MELTARTMLLEARELYRFFHAGDEETAALRGVSLQLAAGVKEASADGVDGDALQLGDLEGGSTLQPREEERLSLCLGQLLEEHPPNAS